MQEKKYSIKNWAKDDRPREKLRAKGARYLSDSELLAILIRNGMTKCSAVDVAKDLLAHGKNDLSILGRLSVRELAKVRGIGETKAIIISAALELGRRRRSTGYLDTLTVTSSHKVADYIQSLLQDMPNEAFGVMYLNQASKIIHHELISVGGITGTVADPRVIFRRALAEDAVAMILFHNHPSGNLRPSRQDEALTNKIVQAAKLFDIRILDHLIVSDNRYFSFADEGLI
jgi:DNA repair protein RadC